ncbi:hypothetical protein [Luteolibacter marinus]|uniref:hypothetical protein n=1 Tax=Luteolibacter marinus TaxID=2776705 RepID=UPI0018688D17|nr:hypothetical protein [Luteolibacter marinus]
MARIRIPNSALDLLPFCQTADSPYEEVLFPNYASLLTMAAGYGHHVVGRGAREAKAFLKKPEPIDLGIFRSQHLYSQLQLLALGCADEMEGEDPLDEEYVCKLIENLADAGCKVLAQVLASAGGPASFVQFLGEEQAKACAH